MFDFDRNVGLWDRVIRVIFGLALISGFYLVPEAAYGWAFWLGVIPVASGLAGWCPVYRLFGWTTHDDGGGGHASA